MNETTLDMQYMISNLIDQSPNAICMTDVSGIAVTTNDAYAKIFHTDHSEIVGIQDIFNALRELGISDLQTTLLRSGKTITIPVLKYAVSGQYFFLRAYPLLTPDRKIVGFTIVIEDISRRIIVEEQLNAMMEERTILLQYIQNSIEEKTILLKEIHHRVKNNLQVISSLLSLQSDRITDMTAREYFQKFQNRVKTMALVHERIYRFENQSIINYEEYIRSLSTFLLYSYNINSCQISVKIDIEDLNMELDNAILCGLIVNELLSNSLKHAFPGGREGEIRIEMGLLNGQYFIMVKDNGIGFPEDSDYRKSTALGLKLVNALTGQLNGIMELEGSEGTKITITFP